MYIYVFVHGKSFRMHYLCEGGVIVCLLAQQIIVEMIRDRATKGAVTTILQLEPQI